MRNLASASWRSFETQVSNALRIYLIVAHDDGGRCIDPARCGLIAESHIQPGWPQASTSVRPSNPDANPDRQLFTEK